jgi:hypothetical protein
MAYSSPRLAKAVQSKYGSAVSTFKADLRFERKIENYVKKSEQLREKSSTSKLKFP